MWSQIIGHQPQIDQIKKALASGRMPNAYLFTGPRGVGKRRIADALAMAIACKDAPSNERDPCGKCQGCRKAIAGAHPDVFVVEPEARQKTSESADEDKSKRSKSENIKIDQLRLLQSRLVYHPLEARAKVAIIDDADRMTEAAANSLLKILEEPPPATHFVLVSTLPHLILPTIRSRCRHMAFQPLADEEVARAISEGGRMKGDEAMRIARLAGGSLGVALAVDPDFVDEVLGRFLALAKRGSSADVIETAEDWSRNDTVRVRLIFDLLASWYRDALRFRATGDAGGLVHPESVRSTSSPPARAAERALAEIAQARKALDTTANKQLMFEHLLFTLTS